MRQSPKDLLRDHRDDEAAVLGWISEAPVSELRELIRLAAKNGLTMRHILPAQMALDGKLAEPHWTTIPNFRATIIAAVAGVLACIIGVLAWLFPRSPAPPNTAATPSPIAAAVPSPPRTQSTATQATLLPLPPAAAQPPTTPAPVPSTAAPASTPGPQATPATKQP